MWRVPPGTRNAGTIEFLLDETGTFYFLEMNTRLQVEHPITEMVTGIDLVQLADPHRPRREADARSRARCSHRSAHAIECRIYAEDPDNSFLPSPGTILQLRAPSGPGVRDDSGATAGLDVPIFYDPMISKLIAWAEDRPSAIARMRRALQEYASPASRRRAPFFNWLFDRPEFLNADFHTTYLDEELKARNGRPFVEPAPSHEDVAAIAAAVQAVMSPAAVLPASLDRRAPAPLTAAVVESPGPHRRIALTCSMKSKSTARPAR